MTIDKELFYASHGLEYPIVARPYTDDMEVKEKFFTEADVVAMLDEIDLELAEQQADFIGADDYNESYGVQVSRNVIREKINALKAERDEKGEE